MALSLSSCQSSISASTQTPNLTGDSAVDYSALVSFLNSDIQKYASTVDLTYAGVSLSVIDEVSSSLRHCTIKQGLNKLDEDYIASDSGKAVSLYIASDNTIQEREITDSNSAQLNFAGNYDSPFAALKDVTLTSVTDYFTGSVANNTNVFTPTSLGLGKITSSFLTFFAAFDGYSYDYTSFKEEITDLKLTFTSTSGSMSFKRAKVDRYGYISENYTCNLTKPESIASLSPISSKLSDSSATVLTSALDKLQEKVSTGNFTQTITMSAAQTDTITYHNYYDLTTTGLNLQLSDFSLTDSTYGKTYTGFWYGTEYYYNIAVSPESNYWDSVNSTTHSFDEIIPHMEKISTDFYTTSNDSTFTFDLSKFEYDDYYFCNSLIDLVLGLGDSISHFGSDYLADSSNYTYDFRALTIEIPESSEEVISYSLSFLLEDTQTVATTKVSYSDFGTTDLRKVADFEDSLWTLGI